MKMRTVTVEEYLNSDIQKNIEIAVDLPEHQVEVLLLKDNSMYMAAMDSQYNPLEVRELQYKHTADNIGTFFMFTRDLKRGLDDGKKDRLFGALGL